MCQTLSLMKLRLTVQRKEYLMSISENIRFFRKEANLTQKDLARKCGLAEITVRQYESGKREPRSSQLAKIAGALNISAVDLYLGQRIEYTDLRSSDTRYRNRLRAYKNVGDVPFTEDQKIRDRPFDYGRDPGRDHARQRRCPSGANRNLQRPLSQRSPCHLH